VTRDEVRALLAYAAASTRDWSPTTVDVDVWADLLGDLTYDDARQALRAHAASSPFRPAPADLRAGVKRIRTDRLDRHPDAVPDANPDDTAAYQRALREGRLRIADGLDPRDMRAIGGTFASPPPADWRPQLPARRTTTPAVLPPVDDEQRMAEARAEVAARAPVPLPDEGPAS
jgi:hypothetical protein